MMKTLETIEYSYNGSLGYDTSYLEIELYEEEDYSETFLYSLVFSDHHAKEGLVSISNILENKYRATIQIDDFRGRAYPEKVVEAKFTVNLK